MPAPAALLPPPVLATVSMEAAVSTERALSTLRTLAATSEAFAPLVGSDSDVDAARVEFDPPDPLTVAAPPAETMEPLDAAVPVPDASTALPPPDPAADPTALPVVREVPSTRWRVVAVVAGVGAAAAATIALLTNLF